MTKIAGTVALALGLLALGTNHANAQAALAPPPNPYCFDFSAFCDCLTVNIVMDNTGGEPTRRLAGTWENQDCAGTTSQMQGGFHDNSYFAGELNTVLGFDGVSFNFTWRSNGLFDLDTITFGKIQDDSPYTIVAGACPVDCSAAAKPFGQPRSSEKR